MLPLPGYETTLQASSTLSLTFLSFVVILALVVSFCISLCSFFASFFFFLCIFLVILHFIVVVQHLFAAACDPWHLCVLFLSLSGTVFSHLRMLYTDATLLYFLVKQGRARPGSSGHYLMFAMVGEDVFRSL